MSYLDTFMRLLFIIIFFLTNQAIAEIYIANNVSEISVTLIKSLKDRDASRSLILFPMDRFLLEPKHPAFYSSDQHSEFLIKKYGKKIKLSRKPYLDELILTNYDQQLSDPNIIEFINELQKFNVPMLAVTRNISGSIDGISHLEVWNWLKLKEFGIDLSSSPLGKYQIRFDKRLKQVRGTYPTLYKGLLSCNSYLRENSPQSILASLFAVKLKWLPDIIYAIDRNEGYLKSLESQFKTLRPDVQFIGFVYAPKEKISKLPVKEFEQFWSDLVIKLNKVQRRELDESGDPYEQ
ncbi:MAG: hypothetical protein DGJ47_000178 [Rickettsiaceae bacterium]